MVLYYGAHTAYTSHVGQCYTDRLASAEVYATSRGYLAEIEIDLSQLKVVSVDGYDRDENTAIGDSVADTVDADVIEYDDEDERGSLHRTWRLMSDKALAAVVVVSVISRDDE